MDPWKTMILRVVVLALACFDQTQSVRQCGEGWYSANSKFGSVHDSCFYFYSFTDREPPLTYGQARAFCQDQGATLVTFNSASDVTDFITWMPDQNVGPRYGKVSGTFMLGYAYLKTANTVIYEGISGDVTTVFDTTKSYYVAPSSPGALGNVIVAQGTVIPNSDPRQVNWTITEVPLTSIGTTSDFGFICKKPVGVASCIKLNKPYLTSFGGRRIPVRPYSRFWLMTIPNVGNITVWTDTTKDLSKDLLTAPTGNPPPGVYPRHGPQMNFVEFTTFFGNGSAAALSTQSYYIYRTYNAIINKYTWFYRIGSVQTFVLPPGNSSTIATSNVTGESITATWSKGGHFDGGWVIVTPTYKFFYDGVDIQVFVQKSLFNNSERGLCDTVSKDQSNPFFNRDMTTAMKTTNLYTFIKGQMRSPQLSPIATGRPISCFSHALFESAVKECTCLIHPTSKLASWVGLGCFMNVTDIDNATNTPFSDMYNNIFQACVESVCSHGPSAKCYYVDKILARMKRVCGSSDPLLQSTRGAVNCSSTATNGAGVNATASCSTQNGGGSIFYNGTCYLRRPTALSMADAQVRCHNLGSQLPAPQSLAYEDNITNNILLPQSSYSSGFWLGILTSLQQNLPHAIPFKKVVATDESLPVYVRSSRLSDSGSDQCVKMAGQTMTYTGCTQDATPNLLCVNYVTDTACPVDCMFPRRCDQTTRTCVDPCPTAYESVGQCPIAFS